MLAYIRKVSRKTADRGATAVEYGLMVAAIAAIIVAVVFGLGSLIKTTFDNTNTCITDNSTIAAAGGTQTDCPQP
jgi:pilus assembly protein Flp/PilA